MARVALTALGGGLVAAGCISPDSPLVQQSSEGCDELESGKSVDAGVQVNPKVRTFMQAASDVTRNAESLKADVRTACAHIATDLGAKDTWSELESDRAISNASGTGACDAAGARIEDALIAARRVDAHVAIVVTRGECHLNFDEQKQCDAECSAHQKCDAGTVVTRCEPAKLSVMCESSCAAGAHCVGREDHPANCRGACESTCEGECQGECVGEDGHRTLNDPNCHGKCAARCNGKCRGICQIEDEDGVACGAEVRCTGKCSGSFTDPVCCTEFNPPHCTEDEDCHEACSAKVAEDAVCDPPNVQVFADIQARPELVPVVKTLNANLPPLFDAAQMKGQLVLDAARRLGDSGRTLETRIGDLDGKSLACLGKASTMVGETLGSFDVTVKASVKVTVTTTDHAE